MRSFFAACWRRTPRIAPRGEASLATVEQRSGRRGEVGAGRAWQRRRGAREQRRTSFTVIDSGRTSARLRIASWLVWHQPRRSAGSILNIPELRGALNTPAEAARLGPAAAAPARGRARAHGSSVPPRSERLLACDYLIVTSFIELWSRTNRGRFVRLPSSPAQAGASPVPQSLSPSVSHSAPPPTPVSPTPTQLDSDSPRLTSAPLQSFSPSAFRPSVPVLPGGGWRRAGPPSRLVRLDLAWHTRWMGPSATAALARRG